MQRVHTHYDNLKVVPNAPTEVIRAAYRALAQKHHPDVNPTPGAARVMQLLNEAWAVLGDPKLRAEHDAWIADQDDQPAGQSTRGSTPPPPGDGQTYTHTDKKPAPSPASDTRGTFAPPHRNPLVHFNVWLGTSKGKTWAGITVLAFFLIPWLLPGVIDRIARSKSTYGPPTQQQGSAVPPHNLDTEASSPPTRMGSPAIPSDDVSAGRRPPFELGSTPPSKPIPTADEFWGKPASPTARSSPTNAGPAPSLKQLVDPRARQEQQSSLSADLPAERWSPNGKPWPTSATYLKGMPVRASGGLSKLTIDNTNGGSDVYVKLCSYSHEKCNGLRHVFIPQGSSFTMNSVAPGTYDIRYRSLESGRIAKSEAMSIRQVEEESGTRYSVMRLTLYTVRGGNTNFTPLSEENF